MPDEWPFRPDVLRKLSRIEYINDDFDKAIKLVDEIAAKYPKHEYGKQAPSARKELEMLRKKEQMKDREKGD